MTAQGADPEALDALARQLNAAGDRLGQIATQLHLELTVAGWLGPAAARFRNEWDSRLRRSLHAAGDSLHEAHQAVLRQAREQREASRAGGGTSGGRGVTTGMHVALGMPVPHIADALNRIDDNLVAPLGNLGHAIRGLGGAAPFGAFGKASDVFGDGVTAVTVAEHVRDHKYPDAVIDVTLAGGDHAASAMKESGFKSGDPVVYLGGAATQTWTEVGRAARDVDWSARGISEIQHASLSDWGYGVTYAVKQMPMKLVKIFSPW